LRRDVRAEHLLELLAIAGDAVELLDEFRKRQIHFNRVLDRPQRLALDVLGAAVPELKIRIARVDDRRSAAAANLVANARGETLAVGPALLGVVATGATDRVVAREPRIEVKLLAEFDLFGRK